MSRIGLLIFAGATSLMSSAGSAATPPTPGVPEAKTFVESVQAATLDPENYDFEAAGFFQLPPQERMQWMVGVFSALGLAEKPVSSQCTSVAQRNGAVLPWVQIAGQATDAGNWQATVESLRARLAELDEMLRRSRAEKSSADPLVQELFARFARDQDVRSIFGQRKWTDGLTPAAADNWLLAANTRMTAIDCDNTSWLQTQLTRIGWFSIPKYGEDADSAAWHLVQHADREPAFQREMLVKLQALPPGQTNGKRLGMLVDRVARAEGRLQKYGTQGTCENGQWTPFESEDPEKLDERRASLGMKPIAEHMKTVSREACPH